MKYFNGFSLQNEEKFFSEYLLNGDLVVAGFSYGAQRAFEYVYQSSQRIDRLILLSPAFFQTQKSSFIRIQLRYFQNDQEAYLKQFLEHVAYPLEMDLSAYLKTGTYEELEALLTYEWDVKKMKEITDRGTTVEVFLGREDKIIDAGAAFAFFSDITTTYFIKDAGHLLSDNAASS